jgi:peptide deformylase
MVLEIVKYGNPVLRAKGSTVGEIDDKVRQLAADMIETMNAANGVGLAAQQVGVPMQIAVIDVADVKDRPSEMWVNGKKVNFETYMPMVLLNPVLELSQETEEGVEGCLSFPELSADIMRAERVKTKAKTLEGRNIEFESTGLLARALQHEVDHLNGVLFIDRMSAAARAAMSGKLKRLQKDSRK